MSDTWTPWEIAIKVDSEGGVWDAYLWGVFDKRTGVEAIDRLLSSINQDLSAVESTWRELQEIIPEPCG